MDIYSSYTHVYRIAVAGEYDKNSETAEQRVADSYFVDFIYMFADERRVALSIGQVKHDFTMKDRSRYTDGLC